MTGVVFAQESTDVKTHVRDLIKHFEVNPLAGKDWESAKKSLAGHDRTELAKALIAELDAERADDFDGNSRNAAVSCLYRELKLPNSVLVAELATAKSPFRKYHLMRCVPKSNAPELTAALVQQLNDKRIGATIKQKSIEGEGPTHGIRVCDFACGLLNENLEGTSAEIGWATPIERRDEIIKLTIKELKLDKQM